MEHLVVVRPASSLIGAPLMAYCAARGCAWSYQTPDTPDSDELQLLTALCEAHADQPERADMTRRAAQILDSGPDTR